MADRGRGQWGRGRTRDDKKQLQQPHSSSQQPSTSVPPSTSAWSRRPGQPQAHASAPTSLPYARPQHPPQTGARGVHRAAAKGDGAPGQVAPERMQVDPPVGAGGDVAAVGRGGMRGGRLISGDNLATKPKNLVTKKGTTGQGIMLQANFFKLLSTTDWTLYQYRVDFSPEEDRTVVRKGLLKLHKEVLGAYIFDGTVLYTSHRLKEPLEFWSVRQSDDTKIRVTIRLVGDMAKGDHHYLQFFNIIMRKCLDLLQLQLVGRDYYDARSKVEIRQYGLELWPGYLTSIRQHEYSILMCSEITHKVMRRETLLDVLNNTYQNYGRDFKPKYAEQVFGIVVLTDYNNNTYRITDVDFDKNPNSTFQLRNGESISYKDYYKNKYQIRITNDSQPMLVTRLKPKERRADQPEEIYLVPELCRSTGITDAMRAQFSLMDALAQHTRVSPRSRIEKLMAFNRRLRSEPQIIKELTEWQLKLDDKLVEIPARILPAEKICLGNNIRIGTGQFANWQTELHKAPCIKTTKLNEWVIICTGYVRAQCEGFVKYMRDAAQGMGCFIGAPRYYEIRDDRLGSYRDALEQIMSKGNPELIFCVVPNNQGDRYTAIKKKCTVDRPVPSQVLLKKQLAHKNARSIATKVAIQLTCKLGGAPWSVELPPIELMVVGFDVCHDTANRSRDYGALVASLDKNLTRYFSAVNAHTTGEELSNDLSVSMVKALQTYKEYNKKLPSHILIYRDGVGEGQIPYVYEHEVEQLKAKLNQVYGDPSLVRMAFVIVTKRINARFFYKQNNPTPGTVVDDIVTNPLKYDFFIVPQSVRQGTVSPTSFSVIADTIGWKADQMQRMTYKLTHMYYNFCGTVRVPAPCQYAHKLAFLVGQHIHSPPSTRMENLLYYL